MALSVKRFIHELDCPEPENQINVTYHATDPDVLCSGGGTPTAIFANSGTTLASVSESNENANGADSGICEQGMDVVFLVDYTSSMSSAIDHIKTGISNLISTIDSESNGDYRLGLVIYDEGNGNNTPTYGASTYYQNLPSAQKINTTSPDQSGYYMFFTAVHKMNTVGNSVAFTNALNVLNQPNGSNGMALGNTPQQTWDEQPGRALYEVVANDFAGSFRSNVQKLVIHVTDAGAAEGATYWSNTLTPLLSNNNVQLMVNTSRPVGNIDVAEYDQLTTDTIPQGSLHAGLSFANSNWTTDLQGSITDLCAETFIYNCESLAVGWYLQDGEQTAYYWNGASWSNSSTCEYTLTINLFENISGATLEAIQPGQTHYHDANTFKITGSLNTLFSITHALQPDPGYGSIQISDIIVSTVSGSHSLSTFTDGGEGTPGQDSSLANDEFKMTGGLTGDAELNVSIRGSATAIRYQMQVNVVSNISTTDYDPNGAVYVTGTGFTGTNTNISKTFIGVMGTEHSFNVALTPNPSDYTYAVTGSNPSYSSDTVEDAMDGYVVTQNNISLTDFVMPIGGGTVTYNLLGVISQPSYDFDLTATENIAGLQISSGSGIGSGTQFSGYTGSTHGFAIYTDLHPDYQDPDLDTPTITGSNTGAVGGITINDSSNIVFGNVTMPSGGGDANVELEVVSDTPKRNWGLQIQFVDPYSDTASWYNMTLTGAAGATVTGTAVLQDTQSDTTYTISSLSSNRSYVTPTTGGGSTTIAISAVMPSGGGTAIVTVGGANTVNTYSYDINFTIPSNASGYDWVGVEGDTKTITVTGAAGSTHNNISAVNQITTSVDHYFETISVTENTTELSGTKSTTTSGTTGDGRAQLYSMIPSVNLTMPSGGGSGTVSVSAVVKEYKYSFNINASTDSGSSRVLEHNCVAADVGVTTTGNDLEKTISIAGSAGETFDIQTPVMANNTTDYRSEINSWSFSPNIASYLPFTEGNSYCGAGYDYLIGTFTMPSLDSRTGLTYNSSNLVIDDTVSGKSHTFVLTSTDNISNVSVSPIHATQYFYGAVGTTHNWSSTYNASSGYNFNITSVSKSGSNSGSVSVTDSTGSNIGGQITMPSGGGSAAVTANGPSSANSYTFTLTFSESVSNAAWRSTGTSTRTVVLTMAPGTSQNVTAYLDTSSSYKISGGLSVSDNSSNISVTTVGTTEEVGVITAAVSMPSGTKQNLSGTVSVSGSTIIKQASLTVNYIDNVTGAYIAREGSVSSGSGTGLITQQVFTGPIGSTGTEWNAIIAESGRQYPVVSSISESSAYITSGTGAGTSNATWADWKFNWQIPPTNQTANITVNGSAIITPTTVATTRATTQGIQYYYYNVEDCGGNQYIARATYSSPRFTYHDEGLVPYDFGQGPVMIVNETASKFYDMTLMGPTQENCEGGGYISPGPSPGGGGGGGGGDNDNELREPGGADRIAE